MDFLFVVSGADVGRKLNHQTIQLGEGQVGLREPLLTLLWEIVQAPYFNLCDLREERGERGREKREREREREERESERESERERERERPACEHTFTQRPPRVDFAKIGKNSSHMYFVPVCLLFFFFFSLPLFSSLSLSLSRQLRPV